MPFKLISLPPDDQLRLLEERFRSFDAEARRQWLLNRKLHFSKQLEASDKEELDDAALESALSEVMDGDRSVGNIPDLSRHEQEVFKADREQERKLAHERILKMSGEEMKMRLKEQFSNLGKVKFTSDNLMDPADIEIWATMVATTAIKAQKHYKDQKDKEDHLKSLRRLALDLGSAITDCDSIQAHLSVSNLLYWSAKDVLDLTTQLVLPIEEIIGVAPLKSAVDNVFQHYVVSVLMVESAARAMESEMNDKPHEELVAFLKKQLGLDDKPITFVRNVQLFQDSAAYLTAHDRMDPERFAQVLAKVMRADLKKDLPLKQKYIFQSVGTREFQEYRMFQNTRDEGEILIRELSEKELVDRLMGERWIQCIGGSARFLREDLLLPASAKKRVRRLVEIVKNQRKNAAENSAEEDEQLDRYKYVDCFITALGDAVECCKDIIKYVSASVFLFWAAAELWRFLPNDDSQQAQEERSEGRAIIKILLRNYLALVCIGESKPGKSTTGDSQITQSGAKESVSEDSTTGGTKAEIPKAEASEAGASKADASKADASKTAQSSTDVAGAEESKTEQSKTGDSETPPVTYNIPSEPVPSKPVPSKPVPSKPVPSKPVPSKPVPSKSVPSTSKKWKCCVLL